MESVIKIIFLILGLIFVSFALAAQNEITIFVDSFDTYNFNVFPSSWSIVWYGMGETFQKISNERYFSAPFALQLLGRQGYSAVVQRKFSSTANIIGYEFKIFVDERGSSGQEHPGFFRKGAEGQTWGTYYAAVIFDHKDGKIKSERGQILGDWQPKQWYKVKVILDREKKTYDVWINDKIVGSSLALAAQQPFLIDALALTSGHAGKKVFYDDVRVFELITVTLRQPQIVVTPVVRGVSQKDLFVVVEVDVKALSGVYVAGFELYINNQNMHIERVFLLTEEDIVKIVVKEAIIEAVGTVTRLPGIGLGVKLFEIFTDPTRIRQARRFTVTLGSPGRIQFLIWIRSAVQVTLWRRDDIAMMIIYSYDPKETLRAFPIWFGNVPCQCIDPAMP